MNVSGSGFGLRLTRYSIRFWFIRFMLCAAVAQVSTANASEPPAITVYAAGSLREAMGALERAYADERRCAAPTGPLPAFQCLFGSPGRPRKNIESVHVATLLMPTRSRSAAASIPK